MTAITVLLAAAVASAHKLILQADLDYQEERTGRCQQGFLVASFLGAYLETNHETLTRL